MPTQFKTYGPLKMAQPDYEADRDLVQAFWDREPDLALGIGIYIFCERRTNARLVPWYVGMTERGFERRFTRHKRLFESLAHTFPKHALEVFFIALHTGRTDVLRKKVKRGTLRTVKYLEFMLVGSCLRVNADLINESYKTLHNALKIPGYLGDQVSERAKPAKAFASMLQQHTNRD